MTFLKPLRTLMLTIGMLAVAACQQAPAPQGPDYEAELGPLFDTFVEVWNNKDYGKLKGVFAKDFVRIAPDQGAESLEAMIAFMRQVHAVYPDFKIVVGEQVYAKDLSFNEWTATATLTAGDGSKTRYETNGITLMRYANGKVTHEIARFDTDGMTQQLGLDAVPHGK